VKEKTEKTPQFVDDKKDDEEPERPDSAGSSSAQAKGRERAMEESGEENAA
jgi:hypothetical protein